MLKIRKDGSAITVETGSGRITWDAARGGEITGFWCKNELYTHKLLARPDTIPGLTFVINGRLFRLSDIRSKLTVQSVEENDRIVIKNSALLAEGNIIVNQTYEIFPEGAVFCHQEIEVPSGKSFTLGELSMNVALDVSSARTARWGRFTRSPWYKKDFSTTHVFYGMDLYKQLHETSCEQELWPLVSIDLGWEETKFFSNKIEFLLDEWTNFSDGPRENTMSRGGSEGGKWGFHWYLHQGSPLSISSQYRYLNKWALLFLTARMRPGKDTDPAMRNNALGCRVAHCMYPYAKTSSEWPDVLIPIRQVACQPPQYFKGNPEISRVDEAADCGANLMIIHQFWMRNPGTNCEPPADYIVKDPEWFKAFVNRCHQRGMRVLTYIRGCEQYHMYQTWFEDYLKRDWDGLYPDWNSPHAMGFTKTSIVHWSTYGYFMYLRAMRKRVGNGGVIIGHTGFAFGLSQSCIDVALGGELSIRHDELLTLPESTAYYACLDCSGAHLIGGNLKDRAEFSGKKAAALCSALGMTGHPVLEPGVPFAKSAAYMQPLWDAMRSLPGHITKLHNPAYSPTLAVSCENDWLFPSIWQGSDGQALLLVTNLDDKHQNGTVNLKISELDVPRNAKVRILSIKGTAQDTAFAKGSTVKIKGLPSQSFCAFLIG